MPPERFQTKGEFRKTIKQEPTEKGEYKII